MFHAGDDLGKEGLTANSLRKYFECALLVYGSSEDGSAFFFECGDGFSCDSRFVDIGGSGSYFSVHGDAISWFDDNKIAQDYFGGGDRYFFVISDYGGHCGLQSE